MMNLSDSEEQILEEAFATLFIRYRSSRNYDKKMEAERLYRKVCESIARDEV